MLDFLYFLVMILFMLILIGVGLIICIISLPFGIVFGIFALLMVSYESITKKKEK